MTVPGWLADSDEVVQVRVLPRCSGETADWPGWLPEECRQSLNAAGIARPWTHQVAAAEAAFLGRHVAITTRTASGKTLAYLLPVMAATAVPDGVLGFDTGQGPSLSSTWRHTAIYIGPTKALAHDQLRVAAELGPDGWLICALDGDSTREEREYARAQARFVVTNPDMLHYSVLPRHSHWQRLLGSLRYVVIDEAHRYRGAWGNHMAMVIRRLRRICAHYGSSPVFVLASATISQAKRLAKTLTGVDDVVEISHDSAPHPEVSVVLWRSRELFRDTTNLMSTFILEDRQTLTFVQSRRMAELVARATDDRTADLPGAVTAYRSGYLPEERREIEARMQSREIIGVAATNALELGIDVSGLDAVLIAGYPGTLASFWQQAGRAGRRTRDGLVVLLTSENQLDHYLMDHPELIFDHPVEATVVVDTNPYVVAPHLVAASQELPLTTKDTEFFGHQLEPLCQALARDGFLKSRRHGWFCSRLEPAVTRIDLRGTGQAPVMIVDLDTGAVVGQVDAEAADRTVHEGAVYMHLGVDYLVETYDVEAHYAYVTRKPVDYVTAPLNERDITIIEASQSKSLGAATISFGSIRLTSWVKEYVRRDAQTHQVLDSTPLSLPPRTMVTDATWLTIDTDFLVRSGITLDIVGAAVHAAEHCAIGLLPMFSSCDRWDIGGLSTAWHSDTAMTTIFIYDGRAGGAGFALEGFDRAQQWWRATEERLESCPCDDGCPACTVSPKCGNYNTTLSKTAALQLLKALSL